MTLEFERTRAVLYTKEFLEELLDPQKTPRIPRAMRGRAKSLLRHYPDASDIHKASKWAVDVFGPVPARPFGLHTVEMTDFTFTIRYQQTEGGCSQDDLIGRLTGIGFTDVLAVPARPGIQALQFTCAAGNGRDAVFNTLQAFRELAPDATLIDVTEQVVRVGSDIPPHIS